MQYFPVCVWLLPLSRMLSRSIRIVTNGRTSFFLRLNNISYVDTTFYLFVHPLCTFRLFTYLSIGLLLIVTYYCIVGMYHNLFKHLSLWFPTSCFSKQSTSKMSAFTIICNHVQPRNYRFIISLHRKIFGSAIAELEGMHISTFQISTNYLAKSLPFYTPTNVLVSSGLCQRWLLSLTFYYFMKWRQ